MCAFLFVKAFFTAVLIHGSLHANENVVIYLTSARPSMCPPRCDHPCIETCLALPGDLRASAAHHRVDGGVGICVAMYMKVVPNNCQDMRTLDGGIRRCHLSWSKLFSL